MKKSLLLLGVAVAAITSCTNDEVLDMNPQTTIGFDAFVNKGTRAVDVTGSLDKFFVFGTCSTADPSLIFNEVAVTNDGTGWKYNGGSHTEWQKGDYEFAAYATSKTSEDLDNVTFENHILTISNYSVKDAQDLVAAFATVDNDPFKVQNEVALSFKHLLSRVKFTLTNANTDGLQMVVSPIVLSTVNTKGTCDVKAGSIVWRNPVATNNFEFAGEANKVDMGFAYSSDEHIVIPSTVNATATFTVSFYNGVDATPVVTRNYSIAMPSTDLVPGYVYNFVGSVAPQKTTIEFTATVDTWKTQDPNPNIN